VLQYKCIFGEGVLNESTFNTLEHIKQISHNILLFNLLVWKLGLWVSCLRLSRLESIELYLIQIFNLLLFCWLQKGVSTSWSGLHFVHFFQFLFPLYFQLLLFLRFDVSLGFSSPSKFWELIGLNHRAHQCFCDIVLVECWPCAFVGHFRFTKPRSFKQKPHHFIFLTNDFITIKFGRQIFKSFNLFIEHELIMCAGISLTQNLIFVVDIILGANFLQNQLFDVILLR